ARSTGPALFVGGWALQQHWLFWVVPLVGAALGGFVYKAALEGAINEPPGGGREPQAEARGCRSDLSIAIGRSLLRRRTSRTGSSYSPPRPPAAPSHRGSTPCDRRRCSIRRDPGASPPPDRGGSPGAARRARRPACRARRSSLRSTRRSTAPRCGRSAA